MQHILHVLQVSLRKQFLLGDGVAVTAGEGFQKGSPRTLARESAEKRTGHVILRFGTPLVVSKKHEFHNRQEFSTCAFLKMSHAKAALGTDNA